MPKVRISTEAPRRFDVQKHENLRFDENVDIVHLETIPKDSENVFSWHQNDRKRVDWTGFWSRWVRKYLKMNFRKHTHPL